MTVYTVDLLEPARPLTADNTTVTADSTIWTADAVSFPVVDFSDATVIALGEVLVVEAATAVDLLDAKVIPITAWGAVWRPAAVTGVGYGVLPRLLGEGHGVVGVAGSAAVTLSIAGEAEGEVEDDDELALLMILLAA